MNTGKVGFCTTGPSIHPMLTDARHRALSPMFRLSTELPLPTSAGHASAPHLDEDGRPGVMRVHVSHVGRQPEPDFGRGPKRARHARHARLGRPLCVACTSHLLRSVLACICVSGWVGCQFASGSTGERTANVCVRRYPIARDLGAVFRCFSLVGLAPGVGRDWMSPAPNYSSHSSHPNLVGYLVGLC